MCGGVTQENIMATTSMRDMLHAGVHFGHRTRFWNPKMAPYIFGVHNKIHIINLEKTLPLYQEACNFISRLAANKGKILFVGTKRVAKDIIREAATHCGMPYVDHRWLGGMLTNYKTVRQSVKRLKDLEEMRDNGTFENMIKKEALRLSRELEKLERGLGGIKEMNGLPDALFVIDVGYENIAITEAARLRIPVVGIVDTNNAPEGIDYVIPGNDDSMRAVQLYTDGVVASIVEGKASVSETGLMEEKVKEKEAEEREAAFTAKVIAKTKAGIAKKTAEVAEEVEETEVSEQVASAEVVEETTQPEELVEPVEPVEVKKSKKMRAEKATETAEEVKETKEAEETKEVKETKEAEETKEAKETEKSEETADKPSSDGSSGDEALAAEDAPENISEDASKGSRPSGSDEGHEVKE